ncbi:MAG TPA: hypothetical protein VFA59_23275 [Vicinamibacterales bacterium]|nr:hypothetical protein [Vicinamibacterales bacterium]
MKGIAFWLGIALLLTWLLGMVGVFAISSATHLLLIAAVVLFVIAFSRDRRSVV